VVRFGDSHRFADRKSAARGSRDAILAMSGKHTSAALSDVSSTL
jgi:hypothetical protein